MISLRIANLENLILFDERYIQVLEIAEKSLYKKIVFLLNKYYNNIEEGNDLILLDNDKKLNFNKNCIVINDFYNIDINTNKFLKLLYNDIEKEYNFEYGDEDIIYKLEPLYKNLQEILYNYDFELEFKRELTVSDLLKSMALKFNSYYYDEPFKNIMCLLDVISIFKTCKIIILINAKTFFEKDELIEIYKAALQRDIKLLLVELFKCNEILKYECKLYIDSDYDEFIEKK